MGAANFRAEVGVNRHRLGYEPWWSADQDGDGAKPQMPFGQRVGPTGRAARVPHRRGTRAKGTTAVGGAYGAWSGGVRTGEAPGGKHLDKLGIEVRTMTVSVAWGPARVGSERRSAYVMCRATVPCASSIVT